MSTRDDDIVRHIEEADAASTAYHGKSNAITDGIVAHVDVANSLRRAGVSRKDGFGKGGVMRAESDAERAKRAYREHLVAKDAAIGTARRDATRSLSRTGDKASAAADESLSAGSSRELEDEVADDVSRKKDSFSSTGRNVADLARRKSRIRRADSAAEKAYADAVAPGTTTGKDVAGAKRMVAQRGAGKVPKMGRSGVSGKRIGHSAKARAAAGASRGAAATRATAAASAVKAKAGALVARVAGAFGGPVVIGAAVAGVVALVLFAVIAGAASQTTRNLTLLTDAERQVAEYLYGIGFEDAQVAGVLAHIQCESGFDPANEFEFGGQGGYAYEVACGLLQYTSTSPGREEYFEYKNWCSANGKDWTDIGTQMYWTFGSHEPPGYWESRWINRTGYYRAACAQDYPKGNALQVTIDAFLQTKDPEEACYLFMAGYGGGTQNPSQLHLARRLTAARSYYAKITSSATGGKAAVVAEAMNHLGKPYVWGAEGPGSFDCSGFTAYCYRVALGIELPHYTEDQLAAATMTVPPEQAEPGDILYKPGHVGISLGGTKCIEAMGTRWGVVQSDRNVWTCALRFA